MTLAQKAATIGYKAGWAVVRYLPNGLASGFFNFVADRASRNGRGPEQLRKNLARVVGPENVTRQLVKDSMRSYMRYWKEAFRLPRLRQDPAFLDSLAAGVQGVENFDNSAASGRGVILALTHSGNWDMAGAYLAHHWGPFTTVAERLKPESLFDAFVRYRSSMGFNVIPLTGGQTAPFELLKERLNQAGVVCLVAERDLTRSGVTVEFFEEQANMAAGPALLAKETGAALHVVHCWFQRDGWGFSVSPEIEVSDVESTTQRMADYFAKNIALHPEDWHMLQPLWNEDIRDRALRREESARRAARAKRG